MSDCNANRASPENCSWDVAFTRLSRKVAEPISTCVRALALRFETASLTCDIQHRQTPHGWSTFLSIIGQRGLICVVDFTLVDGMNVWGHPGAALDVRLLDAHGDVTANCSPIHPNGFCGFQSFVESIVASAGLGLSVTSIHIIAMGHFDLVQGTS